jgi:hypothetical protein
MRSRNIVVLLLVLACISFAALNLAAQDQPAGPDKFSAMAYLPSGAGMRMVGAGRTFNVDIYVESYSSDADAKILEDALIEGGSNAVLKSLEKMKSIGKITLTGRVGFYDLKFIRSRETEGGRRIIAVTDRPISGLEAFYASRSEDYNFGIMELDVKPDSKGKKEKGEGTLIYAAKVKLIKGSTLEIENYGISPVQLKGVREL